MKGWAQKLADWQQAVQTALTVPAEMPPIDPFAHLERCNLLDTVNDLKAAAQRSAAKGGTGAGFNYAPPPDPFTAELLQRDALVTQWSLAYRDAVASHNAERANDAAELRAMRNELHTAHEKIDALSSQLLSSISNEAVSHTAGTLAREKCDRLDAELATLRRYLTDEQTKRKAIETLQFHQHLHRRSASLRLHRPRPTRSGASPSTGSAPPSNFELLQLLQKPYPGTHLSRTSVNSITALRGKEESEDSDSADGQQAAGSQPRSDTQSNSPRHIPTRLSDPGSPSTEFGRSGLAPGYSSL